jgi:hypothetical protein
MLFLSNVHLNLLPRKACGLKHSHTSGRLCTKREKPKRKIHLGQAGSLPHYPPEITDSHNVLLVPNLFSYGEARSSALLRHVTGEFLPDVSKERAFIFKVISLQITRWTPETTVLVLL